MKNPKQVSITESHNLQTVGYSRVERDDRLLDVFPKETAEKGVELWERWSDSTIEIIRIHNGKQARCEIPRGEIEQALLTGKPLQLQ